MPDALFSDPRLAALYDPLDPDRSDLELYLSLVEQFGPRSVLDIGCGTGTLACLLARRGVDVTGVDPAGASLDVARTKSGADRVRWVHGDASALPRLAVDMVTMTGNVAQVLEAWVDVTDVRESLVSFRSTFVFAADGATLTSCSSLRFRTRDEITSSLDSAGFALEDTRDAPDRPGLELVFLATTT
ncbi:MAG: class I SAM-dependent methyltransferase [Actinomycetota bacterium]|nr:class I SAM-dependent methyltransferase [Actinomycetota bacterium]